jgi:hypothetical protein
MLVRKASKLFFLPNKYSYITSFTGLSKEIKLAENSTVLQFHRRIRLMPSPTYKDYFLSIYILNVPDMGPGCCLGPEGNGVSLGEGGEGGPGPPGSKEDKQSVLSKGRDSMDKDEEGGANQRDEEGAARTE